jgi:hypothetical protein
MQAEISRKPSLAEALSVSQESGVRTFRNAADAVHRTNLGAPTLRVRGLLSFKGSWRHSSPHSVEAVFKVLVTASAKPLKSKGRSPDLRERVRLSSFICAMLSFRCGISRCSSFLKMLASVRRRCCCSGYLRTFERKVYTRNQAEGLPRAVMELRPSATPNSD